MFCAQASLAIANARAYRRISDQMRQIERARDDLVEAERLASVGRMAGHLAHEIRNPLATIGGFANSIAEALDSGDKARRSATVIYNEVMRLEATLDKALDFTRPVKPDPAPADLNGLIRETVGQFAAELGEGDVEVQFDLDGELPPANIDAPLVKQVIINLLKNAMAAVENKDRRSIRFGTAESGDMAVMWISDNGVGMDEKTKRTVFAPFFTTKVGGTGLGLSICQNIVAQHGGQITVEAAVGRGSTFRVLLPLAPAARVQPVTEPSRGRKDDTL